MCQTLDSHVLIVYWCVQHLTAVTLFWLMNALYDEMWQFHDRLACMNDPYIIITSSCVTLTKVYLITFRWIHLRDECRYGFSCHICAIHVLQILNATKTSHQKSTIQQYILNLSTDSRVLEEILISFLLFQILNFVSSIWKLAYFCK